MKNRKKVGAGKCCFVLWGLVRRMGNSPGNCSSKGNVVNIKIRLTCHSSECSRHLKTPTWQHVLLCCSLGSVDNQELCGFGTFRYHTWKILHSLHNKPYL